MADRQVVEISRKKQVLKEASDKSVILEIGGQSKEARARASPSVVTVTVTG